MTELGATIFGVYSLIAVVLLATIDLIKMIKGKSKGFEFALLLLVTIYLANIVGR